MKSNIIKHRIFAVILCLIACYVLHQIFYLLVIQPSVHEKVHIGKELNWYETTCVLQTHTNLWLIGWMVEPNTAEACFCKQFHIQPRHLFPYILEDDYVKGVKKTLNPGQSKRLGWKQVNTRAPILLNGATIKRIDKEINGNVQTYWEYKVPMDFAPGIFKIGFISLSEESFNYLEKKGILSVYTDTFIQEEKEKPWFIKLLEIPLPIVVK